MGQSDQAADYSTYILEGLAHLDQGITIFDADLKLVAWNRKFLEMLGYPDDIAFPGAAFESFIAYNANRGEYGPGDPVQQVADRVAVARKFLAHKFERTRPDGTTIEVQGRPLPNGGFVTTYTNISDVTDQKKQLQNLIDQKTRELMISEERLSLIADEVPAGIAHFDENMNFLYVNKRFARAYRKPPSQMIGMNAKDVLRPRVFEESSKFFQQARRGVVVDFEMRVDLPGDRFKDVRTLLRPEKPCSGDVIGFYLVSIDVTRSKATMAALMRSQKMDALGRMASGISHDFNNLLTIILGNLVHLSDQLTDQTLIEELLVPSISAARRGSGLTNRLLTLARREQFDPVPTDIAEAIGEICTIVGSTIPSSLSVVQTLQPDLPMAMVDRSQLEMTILNMALNARDATGGIGTITIECAAVDLEAADLEGFRIPAGRYVRIRFSDDGCGLSPEEVERIFEPFYTSKVAGSGSGLGLSMVYGFVRQSNGAIWVESRPEAGTVFSIVLPIADAVDAVASPPEDTAPAEDAPVTEQDTGLVLLVEDDLDVRRTIRRKVASLGYPLVEAESGEEAASLVEQIKDIGIVLSDIDMPGAMNGMDLARHLRTRHPDIKVILMSGKPDQSGQVADLTGVAFLGKPFTADDFLASISSATVPKPKVESM